MGYNITLLAGYSNAHMGYFATPNEYDIGGYESQLTFWGIETAHMIRSSCAYVTDAIIPFLYGKQLDTAKPVYVE